MNNVANHTVVPAGRADFSGLYSERSVAHRLLPPNDPARRIVAAQVGFTEGGTNWIGYVIHHAPGPMLAVHPTELAKRFSRSVSTR